MKRNNVGNEKEGLAKKKKVSFENNNLPNKSNKKTDESSNVKGKQKNMAKFKNKSIAKSKHANFVSAPKNDKKNKNTSNLKKKFPNKSKFSKESEKEEKPKWSEMKKERKQLRLIRRKSKATPEIFEISHKAKLLASQIQRKVVKPDFRISACRELHSILKGQYKSIALTHDLSRVIQILLKHSEEKIKNEITEELLEIIVKMSQSKYGQHAVKRILKYGTELMRHEVIKKFYGNVVTLATHSISAPILDYVYGEFATKKEKTYMQQEFYGEMYKNTKDDKVQKLSDAYGESPEMKPAILQSCKANMQRILDKNLHDGELLHSVLYDYMLECSVEDRSDLVSILCALIVPLSNSLPGVNAACVCVWQGTNKDKKTILKVVKEHVLPLCKHKTGYRLLLAIFSCVDDTVLVKKTIVSVISANLQDIARNHWGRMVLHWLVKPRDNAAFHPSLIKFLDEGTKSGTSKKDSDIRVAELREAILPQLVENIEHETEFWISDKTMMLLIVALLSIENSKQVLDAVAKAICKTSFVVKNGDKEILAIEDAAIHMCLKKMALLDADNSGHKFAVSISENLDDETINSWLTTNRGCFFLVKLIENNAGDAKNKLLSKLKPHVKLLKKQTSQGANVLLNNVQQ